MRRLLGVLREDDATYEPQPGLARVEDLIEDARAAGVPTELREEGARRRPRGIDLAAYRIVQEALTNVRKHAGEVATTVTVRYHPDGIHIEVVNAPGATGNGGGSGHGIVGMRERARVYGGTSTPGPTTPAASPSARGSPSRRSRMISILIADDQPLARTGSRRCWARRRISRSWARRRTAPRRWRRPSRCGPTWW